MKPYQQVINRVIENEIKFFKKLKQNDSERYQARIRNIHREAFSKC